LKAVAYRGCGQAGPWNSTSTPVWTGLKVM